MRTNLHLLIIELDYHAEVLSTLIPMLLKHFRITLFTTEKIAKKIHLDDPDAIRMELKGRRESVTDFFLRSEAVWREVDIVYLNTLEQHFRFFATCELGVPVIMRVHNVNATFRPWQSIDFKGIPWVKILWHLVYKSRAWHYKTKVLAKVDSVMLPSEGVKKVAEQNGWLETQANIAPFCLPFTCPQPLYSARNASGSVVLAVTGTVDPERKDYNELYHALKVAKTKVRENIVLHFLGPPKGKRGLQVIEQFKSLTDERFRFCYSLGYVPQADVEQVMRSVDFLVAPLVAQTRFKIHQEFYGRTKISGVESDILRFGMPTLLPQEYSIAEEIAAGCGFYCGETDLSELIVGWTNTREFNVRKERLGALGSGDALMQRFEQFCRDLVKSFELKRGNAK